MEKEKFIKALEALQTQYDYDEEYATEIAEWYSGHTANYYYNNSILFNTVIECLAENENELDMIDWFVYEQNFGRNDLEVYFNDEKFLIKSASDLWDFLQL